MDAGVIRNNEGTRREERATLMIDDRKQERRRANVYGKPDCQASKLVAKHRVAVDADDCHH